MEEKKKLILATEITALSMMHNKASASQESLQRQQPNGFFAVVRHI